MTPRVYTVAVTYNGKWYEMLAEATSPAAALKVALKERRTLREAVRDGRASYEVATAGARR